MLRKGSLSAIWLAVASLLLVNSVPAQALVLPELFVKLAASPTLANPGIILLDPASDEIIFSVDPDIGRAPASVLKLISMATVLSTFSPDLTFKTSISPTATPGTFYMQGEADPWLTESPFEAQKYKRAFLPTLINKVLAAHPELKTITLQYSNLYVADIKALQRYFSGRVTIIPVKVASNADTTSEIASIASPTLAKIVEFTLLYSDNVLADRLARAAAQKMGFTTDATGLQSAFGQTLSDLGVSTAGLHVYDGNGLSHRDRVSVRQLADLLVAIKTDPKFKAIVDGLPTAGKTGTLKRRFVVDAPKAVGLVHAKTGWINTTVSLAGYVRVGAKQYVFAVVANHIRNIESARSAARVTIDQMLGAIAKP